LNKQINPKIFYREQFPLSNKYDPIWVLENAMGPHPLWQTEYLLQAFALKPGMRVLDLACGKGMTSVFLAKEFGVHVYAVDFDKWGGRASADKRWENAKAHGVEHLITPIKADAKNLPFASGFFDAIICINSYMYFGQDNEYLQYILKFLRTNGQVGFILTSYANDITGGIPDHIVEFLGEDQLWTWQSLPWWKALWEKDKLVHIDAADILPNGSALWWQYSQAEDDFNSQEEDIRQSASSPEDAERSDTEIHKYDSENGEYMGFIRMVATKK